MTIKLNRILDSTLREGTQTPGVIFSPEESMGIAERLYRILEPRGYERAFIEVGHPYSTNLRPQVESVVDYFSERGYNDVTLIGHCRTLRKDVDIAWDIERKLDHPAVCVFMSTSDKQLLHKLGTSYDKALGVIEDIVGYCRRRGFETVEFTAEDATSTETERLIEIANIAQGAGADVYRIADTKGRMYPSKFSRLIKELVENTKIPIDVHLHNDLDLAMANMLSALENGATGIHTTVMGLGERAGILSLSGSVAMLENYGVNTKVRKELLYDLCAYVSAVSGIRIPYNMTVVGDNVFTHKSGTHQKAVLIDPTNYEELVPEDYGRKRDFEIGPMVSKSLIKELFNISDMGLASNIAKRIREKSTKKKGIPLSRGEVRWILKEEFGIKIDGNYFDNSSSYLVEINVKPKRYSGDVAKDIRRIALEFGVIVPRIRDVTGTCDLVVTITGCKSRDTYEKLINKIRRVDGIDTTNTMTILDEF